VRIVIIVGGKRGGRGKVLKSLSTNSIPISVPSVLKVAPKSPAVFRELPPPTLTKKGVLRKKPLLVKDDMLESPKERLKPLPVRIVHPHKEPVDHGSRDYCISIVRQAEKAGVIKELVLLLSTFRNMYQKKFFANEDEVVIRLRKDQHYSEGSE
jgi:hypothetical protein